MTGYLFNAVFLLCKVVPYFDDVNIFKYWCCYQNLKLLNSSEALRSRHSLFGWMHEGLSPLKYCACWSQRKLLFIYCILHTYSLTFLNKHIDDNNFPQIINIYALLFAHVFFCPRGFFGGPWWSATPKSYLTIQWTGKKLA